MYLNDAKLKSVEMDIILLLLKGWRKMEDDDVLGESDKSGVTLSYLQAPIICEAQLLDGCLAPLLLPLWACRLLLPITTL